MELLYILLVLLTVSRLFAEIAERIQLPPLVGELVAGLFERPKPVPPRWTTCSPPRWLLRCC
jgi:Kef-type K+ transport system membrane component KefB